MFHAEHHSVWWLNDMREAVERVIFFVSRTADYSRALTQGSSKQAVADNLLEIE